MSEIEQQQNRWVRVLGVVGVSEAADEGLDPVELGRELDLSVDRVLATLEHLGDMGLIGETGGSLAEEASHFLTEAGSQYLRSPEAFDQTILEFLPSVRNLHGRKALMLGGEIMVDEFRAQILEGNGLDWAREEIVPQAFRAIVDDRMTIQLYSAAVALMVRLENNEPASCVGEELMAVHLIDRAAMWLDFGGYEVQLTEDETRKAKESLRNIFDLFQDDDVLDLFDMTDPSDAAVHGHSPVALELGVVDQRPQNWFVPFGNAKKTGYLDDRQP